MRPNPVSIGGPIFLAVVGAVLFFAVPEQQVLGVNLSMVGIILMVAALAWFLLGMFANRPRSTVTTERTDVQGTGGDAPVAGGGNQHIEHEVRRDEV